MNKIIRLKGFALLFLPLLILLSALVFSQEAVKKVDMASELSWRVEVHLCFSGRLDLGNGAGESLFDFEMAQVMSMARDNGDYLFADAALPVCVGTFRHADGEETRWNKKDAVPVEPRLYYLTRDKGVSRLPLVIQERNWPKQLPRLVMPRSAEARFLQDGVSYRRYMIQGDNRLEFNELSLFDSEPLVLSLDWQWQRVHKKGTESHRLQGELRFIRLEQSVMSD